MTRFSIVLMLGASITAGVACGKKGGGDLLSGATEIKTRACACKDAACLDKVSKDMEGFTKKIATTDEDPSPADLAKINAMLDETIKCGTDIKMAPGTPAAGAGAGEHADGNLEAKLQLNKIAKNAKVAFVTNGAYVKGKSATLPAGDCCSLPDKKCAADAGFAGDKVWSELDFTIDVPSELHYTYESNADGTSFKATAVGDPGCTGKTVTYTATGTVNAGNAQVEFTGP